MMLMLTILEIKKTAVTTNIIDSDSAKGVAARLNKRMWTPHPRAKLPSPAARVCS
jgi:hypothetical protein